MTNIEASASGTGTSATTSGRTASITMAGGGSVTCVYINLRKASPKIVTTPNPSSGTVGDTLKDSAALSDGFNPTGDIVFKLWGPNNPTCDPTVADPVFTETVPVNGNGDYSTTNGYQTTQVGTYCWTAHYSGNENNNAADSGCDEEQVVVGKAPSTIDTAQRFIPQDTATISGPELTGDGKVDFALYPSSDCSGDAVYIETGLDLDAQNQASTHNDGTPSAPGATDGYSIEQGNLADGTAQDFSWKVTYSGDSTSKDVTSCVENSTVSITDDGSFTSS